MSIIAVLLDLDGTLINSLSDISDSVNNMRIELGLEKLTEQKIKTFIGKGINNLIKKSLEDHKDNYNGENNILFSKAKKLFSEYYIDSNGKQTVLYDKVIDGLEDLKNKGFTLSIVTNKPFIPTYQILKKFNIEKLFSVITCGDTCKRNKPYPDQILFTCDKLGISTNKTIMIGDSSNDVIAAKKAKTAAVLVMPYGYHNKNNIMELNADGVIKDLTKASKWIYSHNETH
ncbi:phosphoglycolate phosphatase [Candidatus Kinetoplastibacterium desouzaii TCC079E]|uniref:phosphoglycolate phosphatase n=1 Tax=Candidatus Kinetoplastidibacterium desouzai TCC079E TaxID=1208919 RepID=M1LTE9_9PROT|nr:HAD-IA family hydrolase [Candidatus Kinetoplastibacterium desouzaii]AGF46604.1 phosphoglycolate phosphatase [Candidatus Kinetoplastibacterium desouzaii TCC079E]